MGFVTGDRKKGDEQQPGGGSGLTMDLEMRACPACRREVHAWQDNCPDCGVQAVDRTSLASGMPAIPAHLLEDEPDAAEDADLDE
ncbi:hypothetical protein [Euzebya tangerina]|uniref:hypothetical protein n=1 Tax=Euzebya tangerina TaxID=591198 RepID=UPI000E31F462|nr:hypothetical protein [Euzebya tangerina]